MKTRNTFFASALIALLAIPQFSTAGVVQIVVPPNVARMEAEASPAISITRLSVPKVIPVSVPPRLSAGKLYPGSLKANIQRIARHYGWPLVVWALPNDYEWVGHAKVSGSTLSEVLSKILENYPLQAAFYQGNHVLVITPRTI